MSVLIKCRHVGQLLTVSMTQATVREPDRQSYLGTQQSVTRLRNICLWCSGALAGALAVCHHLVHTWLHILNVCPNGRGLELGNGAAI